MGRRQSLDLTNGPFLKKIFIFAIPLVFTGLLQLLYNSADTAIVGKFAGAEALAAVGSTGSLINLIINVFMGMSMGGFGAIHTALAYPDRFGKLAGLSSALIVHEVAKISNREVSKAKEDAIVKKVMQNGINEDLLNMF